MTEFTNGIQGAITQLIKTSSIGLAVVYTLGHICIAMTVVTYFSDSTFWEAGTIALVEPAINGLWFYVLHTLYRKVMEKKQ